MICLCFYFFAVCTHRRLGIVSNNVKRVEWRKLQLAISNLYVECSLSSIFELWALCTLILSLIYYTEHKQVPMLYLLLDL